MVFEFPSGHILDVHTLFTQQPYSFSFVCLFWLCLWRVCNICGVCVLTGKITLVCLGPLTNLALALRLDPQMSKKLKEVFILGGNIEGGGMTILVPLLFCVYTYMAWIHVYVCIGCMCVKVLSVPSSQCWAYNKFLTIFAVVLFCYCALLPCKAVLFLCLTSVHSDHKQKKKKKCLA